MLERGNGDLGVRRVEEKWEWGRGNERSRLREREKGGGRERGERGEEGKRGGSNEERKDTKRKTNKGF